MLTGWTENLLAGIRAFNQVLTAGIAITAFSLFLYSLTFNLRDRVARSFAIILMCVVVVFTTEALQGPSSTNAGLQTLLRLQWLGIVYLPAAYLHLSDALLGHRGTTIARPTTICRAGDVWSLKPLSARTCHRVPGGAARAQRPARTASAENHLDRGLHPVLCRRHALGGCQLRPGVPAYADALRAPPHVVPDGRGQRSGAWMLSLSPIRLCRCGELSAGILGHRRGHQPPGRRPRRDDGLCGRVLRRFVARPRRYAAGCSNGSCAGP